ncbi:head-tail adaptor protein [Profundibacterium mesophilum]|uniref:Phage tail-head adaptor n=1 Tax=Profundibacterium mesophilum KAUST100406-0324 TaxID=1037889 RepID=A0A921TCR2_9RHOB|nr:head-tail adaptor protein [Profundibacterium mesophilum]KAF0677415.1 putative phage tail-head adaptor [Profundibacterium mesophilum KAUST100406-0324]
MKVPRLNRPLVLEAAGATPDGAGGHVREWRVLGTLWGAVEPGRGREVAGIGGALSRVVYKITLRAAPQGAPSRPVAGQRLRDGARIFALLSVTEADADGRYLLCIAEEEIAA